MKSFLKKLLQQFTSVQAILVKLLQVLQLLPPTVVAYLVKVLQLLPPTILAYLVNLLQVLQLLPPTIVAYLVKLLQVLQLLPPTIVAYLVRAFCSSVHMKTLQTVEKTRTPSEMERFKKESFLYTCEH
uniref:Uncharacterized protein n=1 Tax=Amphimedon queenslandica TaxID=400682 RepID=A0A1X7UXT5_AMPQE